VLHHQWLQLEGGTSADRILRLRREGRCIPQVLSIKIHGSMSVCFIACHHCRGQCV
jgi:hypothetical protein